MEIRLTLQAKVKHFLKLLLLLLLLLLSFLKGCSKFVPNITVELKVDDTLLFLFVL